MSKPGSIFHFKNSIAASDPLYGELLTRLEADLATHPALDEMLRKAVVALQAR